MISTILYAILAIWSIYLLFFYKSRKARLLQNFPSPPQKPIFGNALDFGRISNENFFKALIFGMEKFQGLSCGWLFNMPYVSVATVDGAQRILSSNTNIDKSLDYNLLKPWLGVGLLISKGQQWFHRRKLLTPAFHFKILEDFMDVFNEQSNTLVDVLREEFGDGRTFNAFPYFTRCALDVICESAMGKAVNAQRERNSEYVQATYKMTGVVQYRMLRPWFYPEFTWQLCSKGKEEKKLLAILHDFTDKVIAERKKLLLQQKQNEVSLPEVEDDDQVFMTAKRRVAFLDLLITAQMEETDPTQVLTDADIRAEVDTFMFEGHDTTAASLAYTAYLLGCHPEYQEKVYEELQEIFGDDRTRPITSEDLTKMKYLECCIKESLRLFPSVPLFARSITSDIPFGENMTLPAGATAFIMTYSLHRDPEVYPLPEVFLPDRFFPENSAGRNPFAYIPFSAGPRNCIGQRFAMMEEKVVLANLFRNFKVKAAERREDMILLAEIIMRPLRGLHLRVIPRF